MGNTITSPALKSVVFHWPPSLEISIGSQVNQPVPKYKSKIVVLKTSYTSKFTPI